MSGLEGIANMALTSGLIGVVLLVLAICAAISYGETLGVKVLGQSAAFLLLFAAGLGVVLGLAAIWA